MRAPRRIFAAVLAGCAALAGCEAGSVTGPDGAAATRDRAGSPDLGILTWNVYVGAPIEAVLAESNPGLIPLRVAEAFAAVQATDFEQRAAAIAGEVARHRPHVVALQEVSLFRMQEEGDVLTGNPVPAEAVVLDYLAILSDALEARGLQYRAVAVSENFDLEVPMFVGRETPLADLRLTDHDVILVREDVPATRPRTGTFAAYLPVSLGGAEIRILRGWASVDVQVKDRTYRVVNTHLEPADAGGVVNPHLAALQGAQVAELLAELEAFDGRTLLVGDLNSAADGSTTSTYADLLAAGFVDAWTVGPDRGDGYTSNQDPDLRNPESHLFHRIDYVLYRDERTVGDGRFRGSVDALLVGEDPADRTPSGLWPSDHAGVMATLRPAPR